MDWPGGSRQGPEDARPGRWGPRLPAAKAWMPLEPVPEPRALLELPVPPGPWPLQGPDRSSERREALRLEGLAPRQPDEQPVLLAAAGPPDAVELAPAPERVEHWAGAAPPWVPLPGSAHSVRARHGSAHCALARGVATRFEVIRRGVGGQWAVAMARLWGPERQAAVLPRPLGERQTRRYTRRSGPGYRPQAPWRDRRDRQWRNWGKSRSCHDPHA
jgi:hypothetical protein